MQMEAMPHRSHWGGEIWSTYLKGIKERHLPPFSEALKTHKLNGQRGSFSRRQTSHKREEAKVRKKLSLFVVMESGSRAPPPACSEIFCEEARIKLQKFL